MTAAPSSPSLLQELGLSPFEPRLPWLNGDLQTLRDTLRPSDLPPDRGEPLAIPVGAEDQLLALLDQPPQPQPRGLVLLMHGLGGSSGREGLRRMGHTLQQGGFAVLRLNMRGAGPGRHLARGTYAANSNRDLLPVLHRARELAAGRPLLGMGISLGGTKLLNALLASPQERQAAGLADQAALLDGLVTISSPLDLAACSRQIERPRNRVYQHWLLQRLVAQTLADPFGVETAERTALEGRGPGGRLRTIRAFDAAITAPRWGYCSVEHYYAEASPLQKLQSDLAAAEALPPALIVHALDDPWVPAASAGQLAQLLEQRPDLPLQVLLTPRGGHNGFHGRGGCWGDQLTLRWFERLLAEPPAASA